MYAAIQKLYFEVNINQHNCTDQAAERNHSNLYKAIHVKLTDICTNFYLFHVEYRF